MNEILNETKEGFGINEFLEFSEKYAQTNFPDLNLKDIFSKTITGEFDFGNIGINIFNLLGTNILEIVKLLITVLIVIIIHSIFKIIIENLENTSSIKVANFIQYLVIVSIVLTTFMEITDELRVLLDSLTTFMNMFIPLLTMLMVSTGNVITSSVVQSVLFFTIIFITNFIKSFLIPMFMISVTLSVVSDFSNKVKLDKLSKFFKSTIIWILGIILTVFVSLLSLETTITSSVDGLTAKTTKAAVTNFIPVVGKIMGDSVDAVIGSFNILKNSVGIIGIIVVLSLTLFPIIKLFVMYVLFNLTTAFSEIIAENSIVNLLDNLSDSMKVLLGIFISVAIMLIIEIVIVIKISNGTLMYR